MTVFLGRHKKCTLDAFDAVFRPDMLRGSTAPWTVDQTERLFGTRSELLTEFLAAHAHPAYNGGLLRVVLPTGSPDLVAWNEPDDWKADWPSAWTLAGRTATVNLRAQHVVFDRVEK